MEKCCPAWRWLAFLAISLGVLISIAYADEPAAGNEMIPLNECSQYAYRMLIENTPQDVIWVPVNRGSRGGVYLKICRKNNYWRVIDFEYDIMTATSYDM